MSIEYNSEANKKKKTLGGRDEDNSRVLSPLILHYLLSYFKNDATITACRSFIDTQVFEGIYNMVIEVGLPDAGHNEQPLFFNNSVFLDALRSFFAEARVYIYVIGAVPLWYYKDPSVWLQKYMNSRSMRDRAALGLPFGVMNATECYIKEVSIGAHGMHRSFQVVPLTEKSHHDVGYTLYNVNLELVDINPDVKEQADLFYDTISQETKQRIDTMTSFPHMAMPRSTFYELATAKERMDIAEASMHEANWNRAHPVVYLISKPPNQLPNPDQMSESMLLGDGSINETRVAERQRISQLIHQQNQHSVQRIKEQVKGDAPPPRRRKRANPYGLTLRQVQKREYGYTDPIEDAFLFDDNVEVAKVDEANVIIDHAMLTKIYGERIFQIMGLPNDVFVSSRALEYRGKQASQATFFSNSMASMMTDPMHIRARMDQHLYEKLFAHVGTAPFDLYHMDKLVDMVMEKDSAVETLMNRVRVVLGKYLSDYMDNSVIYRETPEMILKQVEAMLAAKMDPKKKNKSDVDTMDVDDDEPEEGPELKEVFENIKAALKLVNTLKVSSQGLRYYMISLQAHNPFTQSTARLLFKERDDYVEAMDELKAEMAEEAGNPAPKKKAKKK